MESKSNASKGPNRTAINNDRQLYRDVYYNVNYILGSIKDDATLEDVEQKLKDRGLELVEQNGVIGVHDKKFFSLKNLHCLGRYQKLKLKEYSNEKEQSNEEKDHEYDGYEQ